MTRQTCSVRTKNFPRCCEEALHDQGGMKAQETCQTRFFLYMFAGLREENRLHCPQPTESAASEAKITVKGGAHLSGAGRCLFKICPSKSKSLYIALGVAMRASGGQIKRTRMGLVLIFGCAHVFGGCAPHFVVLPRGRLGFDPWFWRAWG